MHIKQILAVLAIGTMVMGCATMDRMTNRNQSQPAASETYEDVPIQEPGLKLSTEQRFDDVPLPVNVREDTERTFVYESSSLQIGRMVYSTRATVNEIVSFYIRECPVSNWELQSVVQADGAELLFTKPGKRLLVSVTDMSVARAGAHTLILTLVPEE